MDDEQLDRALQAIAKEYHQPGEAPRREMWLRLQQARAARRVQPIRRRTLPPLVWAAGAAALLAIGVGLGRLSIRPAAVAAPRVPAVAVSQGDSLPSTVAYRVTMAEHLAQAEIFLTLFRMSVRRGTVDPLTSATARPLLTTNRLLLDSPVSSDPEVRSLLEDLELVLARLAQLSPRPAREDVELITRGMEQTGVMVRVRSQVPAGPLDLQGAL